MDNFEDCDLDVARTKVRKADRVSAAPNALTECQRVRCERPRGCKGGTADAYKESRLRRASGPPSSSEHRGKAYTPNAGTGSAGRSAAKPWMVKRRGANCETRRRIPRRI